MSSRSLAVSHFKKHNIYKSFIIVITCKEDVNRGSVYNTRDLSVTSDLPGVTGPGGVTLLGVYLFPPVFARLARDLAGVKAADLAT